MATSLIHTNAAKKTSTDTFSTEQRLPLLSSVQSYRLKFAGETKRTETLLPAYKLRWNEQRTEVRLAVRMT